MRRVCCFNSLINMGASISIDFVSKVQLHFAAPPVSLSTDSENSCGSYEPPPEKIKMDKLLTVRQNVKPR